MRFNPKADIGGGRVQDAGGYRGRPGSQLPIPSMAGGSKAGLIMLILGLVFRFLQSRRSSR